MHGTISEAYSQPSQTSEMALFAKIINDFQPLTIFTESTILDVQLVSEYVSGSLSQYVLRFFLSLAEFQPQFSYKTVLIRKECIPFCYA